MLEKENNSSSNPKQSRNRTKYIKIMSAIRVENKVTQHGSCNCNLLFSHQKGENIMQGSILKGIGPEEGLRNA